MFALHGAEKRLLPLPAVGVAFTTAIVFQPLSWGMLVLFGDTLAGMVTPGFGPAIAAIHALTLGVLLPVAMTAAVQILGVVTMQAPPPGWRMLPSVVLVSVGATGVVAGAAAGNVVLALAAVIGAAGGLALFAFDLARLLLGARRAGFPDTRAALWVALGSLAGFALLALALGFDLLGGWLPDHQAVAAAHAVLACFGFMGFLALGFSLVLLPMLAIAEPPPSGRARLQVGLGAAGLVVAVGGLLAGIGWVTAVGAALGLAAAVLHVRLMRGVLRRRLRRTLGDAFVLVRLSWAMLIAALALAVPLALGLVPAEPGLRVFGLLLLHGWLLSLVVGMLQRILPFLASMHVMASRGKALSPAALSWDGALRIHLIGHCAALALSLAGAVLGDGALVATGGVAGAAGGTAFAGFAGVVFARVFPFLHIPPVPLEAS
jgi:hypothetical protein